MPGAAFLARPGGSVKRRRNPRGQPLSLFGGAIRQPTPFVTEGGNPLSSQTRQWAVAFDSTLNDRRGFPDGTSVLGFEQPPIRIHGPMTT
jgi:hypothetical protein